MLLIGERERISKDFSCLRMWMARSKDEKQNMFLPKCELRNEGVYIWRGRMK